MVKPLRCAPDTDASSARRTPERDAHTEPFFRLNQQFGEVVDGRALGPDDFITDPSELAKYTRPTEEEIRALVIKGVQQDRQDRRS